MTDTKESIGCVVVVGTIREYRREHIYNASAI